MVGRRKKGWRRLTTVASVNIMTERTERAEEAEITATRAEKRRGQQEEGRRKKMTEKLTEHQNHLQL